MLVMSHDTEIHSHVSHVMQETNQEGEGTHHISGMLPQVQSVAVWCQSIGMWEGMLAKDGSDKQESHPTGEDLLVKEASKPASYSRSTS